MDSKLFTMFCAVNLVWTSAMLYGIWEGKILKAAPMYQEQAFDGGAFAEPTRLSRK